MYENGRAMKYRHATDIVYVMYTPSPPCCRDNMGCRRELFAAWRYFLVLSFSETGIESHSLLQCRNRREEEAGVAAFWSSEATTTSNPILH